MDFANEYYVRIYTRDTTTWKRLRWHGQNVLMQVLRKMDLAGVLDIEDMQPWEAVVLHCGATEADAREGMARCLELGVFVHNGRYLVAPNYRPANEASKTDKQRQYESRARRRATAMEHDPEVTKSDGSVTKRDNGEHVTKRDSSVTSGHACASRNGTAPSRIVTERHERSHAVTLTNSGSGSVAVASPDPGSATPETTAAASVGSTRQKLTDRVAPEDVSREWHRIGQPVWNNRGVLNHPTSHHRESYEVIASSCNATTEPIATLAALLEYFWVAPHGPIASGRITRPKPIRLAEGVTDDLAEALAWKRGEPPRNVSRGTNSHTPNGQIEPSLRPELKPFPPMPKIPREVPQ